jgi:hypothetical protein
MLVGTPVLVPLKITESLLTGTLPQVQLEVVDQDPAPPCQVHVLADAPDAERNASSRRATAAPEVPADGGFVAIG